jgi:hypothetical protein
MFHGINKVMPRRYTELNFQFWRGLVSGTYWKDLDPEHLVNSRISYYINWYDRLIVFLVYVVS